MKEYIFFLKLKSKDGNSVSIGKKTQQDDASGYVTFHRKLGIARDPELPEQTEC